MLSGTLSSVEYSTPRDVYFLIWKGEANENKSQRSPPPTDQEFY